MTDLQQIRDWIMPLLAILALLVAIGQAKQKIHDLEERYRDLSEHIDRQSECLGELKRLIIRHILEKDKGEKK